jgi:transaldolase/glucose-6-phosphate isomerase
MDMQLSVPADLQADLDAALIEWSTARNVQRLWNRDASLWTAAGEDRWLGWLDIVRPQLERVDALGALAVDIRDDGFEHVLVLGMGGSSLCPELLRATWGSVEGWPTLHVLDSTDPAQVLRIEGALDVPHTLFVVSSKSGGTLESDLFRRYFFDRVASATDSSRPGRQFIAITDPGSPLETVARRDGFRRVVAGVPSIGGRYSALSDFGMVPAALMGLDVRRILERAARMVDACGPDTPERENPGVVLGLLLGLAARRGRDKVTFVTSPGISGFGAWLEQLIAESTGKRGLGLIPSDGERPGAPHVYGTDRLFVHLRLNPSPSEDAVVGALERAGHPLVRITLSDPDDLGREFFRWEFATAVAGAVLGVDPFGQPDVEASKVAARALTERFERDGVVPVEAALSRDPPLAVLADDRNARDLRASTGGDESVASLLGAHLARLGPGDYFALLAYLDMNASNASALEAIRHDVRDRLGVATCVGFGPRFLHSTGQAHKGGPDSGVFLQITGDDARDVAVPGRPYTFGVVKAAQARGDLQILAERGRRLLRVHLGADVSAGLDRLRAVVRQALATP